MEKIVIFDQWQKVTTADANNIGAFGRKSMDDTVKDIGPSWGFTGFVATQSAPAVVTVGNGRLYDADGKIYFNDDAGGVALNFLTLQPGLPAVTKRIAAIVVWGQEVLTDTEPRTFITDATTRATEARPKATTSTRHANIQAVLGIEGPDPQKPTVASNVLVVAWVTLTPTGIETIQAESFNRVRSLRDNSTELDTIESWRANIGAQLDTINTMLSALAQRINGATPLDTFLRLVVDVTHLKEKADLPDTYSDWASDYFLDEHESDTGNVAYLARIEEGIRFSKAAEQIVQLSLANVLDSTVRVTNNFVLPAYHETRRLANVAPQVSNVSVVLPVWPNGPSRVDWLLAHNYKQLIPAGAEEVFLVTVVVAPTEISISQFANQTFGWTRAFRVRYRWRWGAPYYKSSRVNYWFNLTYDPVYWTFKRRTADSSFVALNGPPYPYPVPLPYTPFAWKYNYVRGNWFWLDYITDHHYWDRYITTGSVNGSVLAQTFLNAQDGWLVGMHLFFTRRGAAGNVTVLLCETNDSGQPQKDRVISSTTLVRADINLWPNPTRIDFDPTLLTQGKRYAIIPITSGAHFIATTERNQLISGTLFYSTDQVWFQGLGDMSRDMCFELIYAEFESNRAEVQLGAATLTGGIAAIDINADAQVPNGTSLTFEAQIGSAWVPMTDPGPDGSQPLTGLPALTQMRAVFTGTPALMPGLAIGTASELYTWRPRADFKHISTVRTTPAAVNSATVTMRLENWLGGAHHTCLIKLLKGAGYTTVVTAASVVDTVAPDDSKALIRKATFTTLGAITTYKVQVEGTTDNVLTPFHISERVDIAFA